MLLQNGSFVGTIFCYCIKLSFDEHDQTYLYGNALRPIYPSNRLFHYRVYSFLSTKFDFRTENEFADRILKKLVQCHSTIWIIKIFLPHFFSSIMLAQSICPLHRLSRGTHTLPQLNVLSGHFRRVFSLKHWYTWKYLSRLLQYSVLILHRPPQPKIL